MKERCVLWWRQTLHSLSLDLDFLHTGVLPGLGVEITPLSGSCPRLLLCPKSTPTESLELSYHPVLGPPLLQNQTSKQQSGIICSPVGISNWTWPQHKLNSLPVSCCSPRLPCICKWKPHVASASSRNFVINFDLSFPQHPTSKSPTNCDIPAATLHQLCCRLWAKSLF